MKKEAEKSVHGLRLMVIGCIAAIVIVIATVYLVFSGGQTLKLAETSTGKYEDAMYDGYELEIKSQVQAAIMICFRRGRLPQRKRQRMQQRSPSVLCVTVTMTVGICGLTGWIVYW